MKIYIADKRRYVSATFNEVMQFLADNAQYKICNLASCTNTSK